MAKRIELATLTNTAGFTDRLRMCVTYFAQYIIGEDPNTASHDRRSSWARNAIISPGGTASQISALVALDPIFANVASPVSNWETVLAALPETGAGSLQAAAEAAINNTILRF